MSNEVISTPMEFKNYKTFHYTLAGRPLVIETGKMAGLANGSVLIRYGDTAVLKVSGPQEEEAGEKLAELLEHEYDFR